MVRPDLGPSNCGTVAQPSDLTLGPLSLDQRLGRPGPRTKTYQTSVAAAKHSAALLKFREGRNEHRRELRREEAASRSGVNSTPGDGGVPPSARKRRKIIPNYSVRILATVS